jgi:hypothetical protein
MDNNEILFYEEQKPAQKWMIFFVLGYSAFVTYITYNHIFLKEAVFDIQISDQLWTLLWVFFALIVPVLFFLAKMITKIQPDGIYIKYFPFQINFVKINPEDIQSFESIIYNPIKDYGGWGLRYGIKGNAINASGNRGINLQITYARNMLIGTQKPQELFDAIQKIKNAN